MNKDDRRLSRDATHSAGAFASAHGSHMHCPVSIVIPTYGREQVLVDTIRALLEGPALALEIVVMDQTPVHEPGTARALEAWQIAGLVRVIRLSEPGVVMAMNRGLGEARAPLVLFLDDDIIPDPHLVEHHCQAHRANPRVWAVVGRVIQPGGPAHRRSSKRHGGLRKDLDFRFDGSEPAWVENVMAGNLSVKRDQALAAGGFDLNFVPPVSYRFETEFARRLIAGGGQILFEPRAAVQHLRAARGGTRSIGSHLNSVSPLHGVGDYYYALRHGVGRDRFWYMATRPFREVCTRYHLKRPWYIPVKFTGELRALAMALRLYYGSRVHPHQLAHE